MKKNIKITLRWNSQTQILTEFVFSDFINREVESKLTTGMLLVYKKKT